MNSTFFLFPKGLTVLFFNDIYYHIFGAFQVAGDAVRRRSIPGTAAESRHKIRQRQGNAEVADVMLAAV